MVVLTGTVSTEREGSIPGGAVVEVECPEEVPTEGGEKDDVKVNTSEQTPVEDARDEGSSVVESALTKTADTTENGEFGPLKPETTTTAAEEIKIIQNGQAPIAAEILEDKDDVQTAGETNTATLPCLQSEDKMDIIPPEATEPHRGEKRSREEHSTGENDADERHGEQINGNEAKRPKLDNGADAAANGHTANGQSHSANGGDSAEAEASKGASPKRAVKKPGRPSKKADIDAPLQAQAVVAEPVEETIARRTRSKA